MRSTHYILTLFLLLYFINGLRFIVYLFICVFVYLCICVFVYLCTCALAACKQLHQRRTWHSRRDRTDLLSHKYAMAIATCEHMCVYSTYCILWLSYIRYGHRNVNTCVHSTVCCILWLSWYAFTNMWNALFWSTSARLSRLSTVNAVNQM